MPDEIKRELHWTRRNLPHWQAGGKSYFVTWNTTDGIELNLEERRIAFEACRRFHRDRYIIYALVVMPDHVHMLIRPLPSGDDVFWHLGKLLGGMKGFSAREINARRDRKGAVWQDESYDRILREGEFTEKWQYIRLNPVRAGLVRSSADWETLWLPATSDGWMPSRP